MNTFSFLPRTLAFAAALALCCGTLQAQTYQWKDANGKTIISDTPPPNSAQKKRSVGVAHPKLTTASPAENADENKQNPGGDAAEKTPEKSASPQTTAEKDLEFRKRQQEAKEKAEKDAKEAAAARDRRENCDRARANYRMLQSDIPVLVGDKDMTQKQRQQEMERTRRIMQESCK
ncbi:DUF4124 domain-containing protein [Azonexus sp.]|uniref:DUF4124 domain-containing protein n=1 Tax=Azonexus sp. TaxID=1872668 RepID=UPI0039E35899